MKKIPGETTLESHALYLFLRGVKDLYFDMTVEIKKNRDDNTHMQYVNDIHKKEREVKNKISTDRKCRKQMSHVC